jgi:uncharacterized protein
MNTFGVMTIAGGVALLALASHAPAQAQSADLVLCDRLAADPADPDKPGDVKGVTEVAPSDVATAVKFCGVASKGSRRAMYQLGRAHFANRQYPDAIAAYRRAADKGSTSAMVELGVMYANGAGVPRDEAQARALLERAASAGNPRGVANLMALGKNAGTNSDPAKARALLSQAAETNAEAQFQLGLLLADGAGGPQDDAGARALFEKAAAQGHAGALERAGAFAAAGRGGPKDSDAAKEYYRKSAALGNEDAKAALKRAECPIVIANKQGKRVTDLCW